MGSYQFSGGGKSSKSVFLRCAPLRVEFTEKQVLPQSWSRPLCEVLVASTIVQNDPIVKLLF